ncbi:hypothetical protein PMZ80_001342 [Knufia obscura]|uniref:Uncharacterized protein n=1 Tax=Knufia obscura TaxID=1635080 RepID=A0ABR0S3V0_9EURO|nr:hypothetical protein PMZ80_001342 [Knufia obscura]
MDMTPSEPSRSLSPVELFAEAARDIAALRPKMGCSGIHIQHVEDLMSTGSSVLQSSQIYVQHTDEPTRVETPPVSLSRVYTVFEEQESPEPQVKLISKRVVTTARKSRSTLISNTRLYLDLTKEDKPWVRADGTPKPDVEESIGIINNTRGRVKYCLRCGKNDHKLKNCTWFPSATLPCVKHIGAFPSRREEKSNDIIIRRRGENEQELRAPK